MSLGSIKLKNPFILPTREDKRLAMPRKTNKLGIRGVSYHKPTGKFRAKIGSKGKIYELGYFETAELAREKYLQAAEWLVMNNGEPFPGKDR